MRQQWCVQTKRSQELSVAMRITAQGYETFLPVLQKVRTHNHRREVVSVPRFPRYIFAKFDAIEDEWGPLCNTRGVTLVMCSPDGIVGPCTAPVPEEAMAAMRAYVPAVPIDEPRPYVYTTGEPVRAFIDGTPLGGVFVGYARGRAMVRLWLFGAERIIEVARAALEVIDPEMEQRVVI